MADNSALAKQADERANPSAEDNGQVIYAAVVDYDAKMVCFEATSKNLKQGDASLVQTITERVMTSLTGEEKPPGKAFAAEGLDIYYSSHQAPPAPGFTLIHMTTPEYKTSYSAKFQQQVSIHLQEQWQKAGKIPAGLQKAECEEYLREQIHSFTENPPVNIKLQQVYEGLEATKQVVMKNVQEAIDRHGKISIINEEADELSSQSRKFQKNAKSLKNAYCCANAKWYICIAAVVVILIGVMIAVICVTAKC